MGAYAVVLLVSRWLLHAVAPGSALAIALAIALVLAPVVPIAFVVGNGLRALREADEVERRILLEGSAFAQPAFVLAAIAYGFLQAAGFPAVNLMFAALALIALTALGRRLAAWKYR
jgi:hypothetical protein